ncbi:hypothetical protein SLS62_006127 [Diatrype stigma]|uniref:Uncharacterized protein n=1 Tax=Diatrype stigma TaxID=117547 RepID=A0AAN9UPU5_9PEZI
MCRRHVDFYHCVSGNHPFGISVQKNSGESCLNPLYPNSVCVGITYAIVDLPLYRVASCDDCISMGQIRRRIQSHQEDAVRYQNTRMYGEFCARLQEARAELRAMEALICAYLLLDVRVIEGAHRYLQDVQWHNTANQEARVVAAAEEVVAALQGRGR